MSDDLIASLRLRGLWKACDEMERQAAEIGRLQAEVERGNRLRDGWVATLSKYSCGCGDLSDPPVNYVCPNCATAMEAAHE